MALLDFVSFLLSITTLAPLAKSILVARKPAPVFAPVIKKVLSERSSNKSGATPVFRIDYHSLVYLL